MDDVSFVRSASQGAVPELPEFLASCLDAVRCRSRGIVRVHPRGRGGTARPQPQVSAVRLLRPTFSHDAWRPMSIPTRAFLVPLPERPLAEGVLRDRSCGESWRGELASLTGLPVVRALEARVVAAPGRQAAPDRHGVGFRLRNDPGTHLVLIDDVLTPGETAASAVAHRSLRYLHPDGYISRYYVNQERNRSRTREVAWQRSDRALTWPVERCATEPAPNPRSYQAACCAVFDFATRGGRVTVRVHGRNMQVPEEIRTIAEDRVEHAGRIFDDGGVVDVEFTEYRNPRIDEKYTVEITSNVAGHIVRIESGAADERSALDAAADKFETAAPTAQRASDPAKSCCEQSPKPRTTGLRCN